MLLDAGVDLKVRVGRAGRVAVPGAGCDAPGMPRFAIQLEREEDGRFIAEVAELPGVMAYGATRDEAIRKVEALALRVIADRIEHGELAPDVGALFSIGA